MGTIFRTPYRYQRPGVCADTPLEDQSPAKYFGPSGRINVGVNVWVTTAGVVTEVQPPQWSDVAVVYYGGREIPVTAAEVAFLTAHGYGAFIFSDTTTPPVTGGGGGTAGYGVGPYGSGSYGA